MYEHSTIHEAAKAEPEITDEILESEDFIDEEEEDVDDGIQTVILRKPITFEGKTIESITLDLDSLTAGDLMKAEREANLRLKKSKRRLNIPKEMDDAFASCVAARAAKMKTEAINSLFGQDYTTVCMAVANFLLGGESSEQKTSLKQKDSTKI